MVMTLEEQVKTGYFPELGKKIRERRERKFCFPRKDLGKRLADVMGLKPSTAIRILYDIEDGRIFGNYKKDFSLKSASSPQDPRLQLNQKTAVYLTALGLEEDDEVITTLRKYYNFFEYPHSKRVEILKRVRP